MNSFNHYGLGSIGDWLYDDVGGLAPAQAGYKKHPRQAVHRAGARQRLGVGQDELRPRETATGRATPPGGLKIDVDVPVNTRAEVHVPVADGQQVLESGKPAAEQPGVTYKGTTNGDAVYEVGSGSYSVPGHGRRRDERQRRRRGNGAGDARADAGHGERSARSRRAWRATTPPTSPRRHQHGRRRRAERRRPERDRHRATWSTARFALAQPLLVKAGAARSRRSASNPTLLASWNAPVSNDPQTISFKQSIGANEGLRTGSLQQDADLHAVDDDTAGSPPWPRSAWPRRLAR